MSCCSWSHRWQNVCSKKVFLEDKFGKKLPIIFHGLEYAWYDIEATKIANINGEADTFLEAMKLLGMV